VTEKPKRRFWQIHLSTAIILMFVAGALLWANTRRQEVQFATCTVEYYGWPQLAYQKWQGRMVQNFYGNPTSTPADFEGFAWKGLGVNFILALAILAAIGAGVERLARRRSW
jgi:hypothetical protein